MTAHKYEGSQPSVQEKVTAARQWYPFYVVLAIDGTANTERPAERVTAT
jgi:hypothetical protein